MSLRGSYVLLKTHFLFKQPDFLLGRLIGPLLKRLEQRALTYVRDVLVGVYGIITLSSPRLDRVLDNRRKDIYVKSSTFIV